MGFERKSTFGPCTSILGPFIFISPPTFGTFPPISTLILLGSKFAFTFTSIEGLFNSSEAPFPSPNLRSSIFGNLINFSGTGGIFPTGTFLQ